MSLWEEKAGYETILKKSKDVVREKIKEKTGLRLEYVCVAGVGTKTG